MKKQEKPRPPKTKNTILTTVIIIIGLFLLSSLFAGVLGFALLFGEQIDDGNVAVVEVKGLITGDSAGGYFDAGTSASSIVSLLERAGNDEFIEAVVVEINSPGGTPVASAEIAAAIASLDKPTVAWIRDSGASGGYWIASAADHVIAHELSITGSIGVYGSYLEFSGLLDDYNVTYQRLVAGERKDAGSPLRPLSSYEESLLQGKLDKMHEVFIGSVAQYRNLSYEEVAFVSDGMFLLGSEAYEAGLVDELGGKEEVLSYLESLNITPDLAYFHESATFADLFLGVVSEHGYATGKGFGSSIKDQRFRAMT